MNMLWAQIASVSSSQPFPCLCANQGNHAKTHMDRNGSLCLWNTCPSSHIDHYYGMCGSIAVLIVVAAVAKVNDPFINMDYAKGAVTAAK